jgi:hypothetical protein
MLEMIGICIGITGAWIVITKFLLPYYQIVYYAKEMAWLDCFVEEEWTIKPIQNHLANALQVPERIEPPCTFSAHQESNLGTRPFRLAQPTENRQPDPMNLDFTPLSQEALPLGKQITQSLTPSNSSGGRGQTELGHGARTMRNYISALWNPQPVDPVSESHLRRFPTSSATVWLEMEKLKAASYHPLSIKNSKSVFLD